MDIPEGSGRRKAARLVWEARRRAGLKRSQLAERAGLPPRTLRRIEAGEVVPRLDTVARLLLACGRTLSTEPRPTPSPSGREPTVVANAFTALRYLRGAYLAHVVVGDLAAWLHGAAVDVTAVEILIPDRPGQRGRLLRVVERLDRHYSRVSLRADTLPDDRFAEIWRAARHLGPVPTPVASIDDLIEIEPRSERRQILRALREERDRGEARTYRFLPGPT